MTAAVAFDHRTAGTPESAWPADRFARLPVLPVPGAGEHLVVLAAHPDDETLGAGGLVHAALAAGARVSVVVATAGEGSHPHSPTVTPARLAARRRAELATAVSALGVGGGPAADLHLLDLPDGGLDRARAALAAAVAPLLADATVLLAPYLGDGHPDHAAVAEVAGTLARGRPVWEYPVWLWHWATPAHPAVPWDRLAAVPLTTADRAAKALAVAAFGSQTAPLSPAPGDEAVLPPDVLAHFARSRETFVVRDRPDAAAPGYYDALYAAGGDDPWGLDTRFYERRKRELLLAALPRPRFRRVFEPGCATGLLTAALAARADEVVAWDVADAAVARTAARVPGAVVRRGRIPDAWPEGVFDLVVLSEVGYLCPDLDALVGRVVGALASGGLVAAVHWRHPAPDHPHGGDAVHAAFARRLLPVSSLVEEDFRLDVWGVDPLAAVSPARREGIVR